MRTSKNIKCKEMFLCILDDTTNFSWKSI